MSKPFKANGFELGMTFHVTSGMIWNDVCLQTLMSRPCLAKGPRNVFCSLNVCTFICSGTKVILPHISVGDRVCSVRIWKQSLTDLLFRIIKMGFPLVSLKYYTLGRNMLS